MSLQGIRLCIENLLAKRESGGWFAGLFDSSRGPGRVEAVALQALLQALAPPSGAKNRTARGPTLVRYFDAARDELASNVDSVARLAETAECPPFAYVTWLWRVWEVLHRLDSDGWLEAEPADPLLSKRPDRGKSRQAVSSSSAPQLAAVAGNGNASPNPIRPPKVMAPELLLEPLPSGSRGRGLAVQPLLAAAYRETRSLERRRRLFEAARLVLLEAATQIAPASSPGAEGTTFGLSSGVQERVATIARRVREINQWQAAGVDPNINLVFQLGESIRQRRVELTQNLLGVLESVTATAPKQTALHGRVSSARSGAAQRFGRQPPATVDEFCRTVFGSTAAEAIRRGCARARAELGQVPKAEVDLIQAGACVDGCFELGRSVTPVRVYEEQRRMVEVRFPTQTMVLCPATTISDIPASVLGDPRLVLHDFASHSLLSRRYLAHRKSPQTPSARYTEARYYLLDGSASMAGRRGRMRDAIILMELAAIIRHLECGTATARPVVYYRYFSKAAEPRVKASSIEEARSSIEGILTRKSRGETDIEHALVESFADIQAERTREPTLGRAQLVLISDGIAKIDLGNIWAARQRLGSLPVHVSIIALASENAALKELASTQRARGEPVFYHYLDEQTLHRMLREAPVALPRTPLVSEVPQQEPLPETAASVKQIAARDLNTDESLWRELDALVDELGGLAAPPDLETIETARELEASYAQVGLNLADDHMEAERAHLEEQRRDLRALQVRFDRWFPDVPARATPVGTPPSDLLLVLDITLETVAELITYLDGSPLQRRLDAIELLEALLVEAGISPWAYCQALPHASQASRCALTQIRLVAAARDPR